MEGNLIRLRRAHPDDTEARVRWFENPEVRQNIGSGVVPLSHAQVRSYLEASAASHDQRLEMAILVKETGEMVGGCTLRKFELVMRTCEFGIAIDRPHWGKGYGTEATRLMAGIAFEQYNMNKVYLTVHATNVGGIKAYERAGFVREGLLRQHAYNCGEYRDVVFMGCLRSDWEQIK